MNTGIKEIDAVLAAMDKKFGKGLFDDLPDRWEALSTGSFILDTAIGIGGIPREAIIELYGWQGTAKTSLGFQIIAKAQEERRKKLITDMRDIIIDLEHTHTRQFIEGFGIDMDQVIWARPDTAEQAFQIIVDLPKSGKIDMCMFDSVDAAQNALQLSRDIGATDVGGISKLMSDVMRRIAKYRGTTFLFINQLRQNPGVSFGNPNVTPGGNALPFYAVLRLEMLTPRPHPSLFNTMVVRCKIAKTKVARPRGKEVMEMAFEYGKGFNPYIDLLEMAKTLRVIMFAGKAIRVSWQDEDEWESIENNTGITGPGASQAALLQILQEDEDLFKRLQERCLEVEAKGILLGTEEEE